MKHLEHRVHDLLGRARPVRNDHFEYRGLTKPRTGCVPSIDYSIGEEHQQVLLLLPRHRFSLGSHVGKTEGWRIGLETPQGSISRHDESMRMTRIREAQLPCSVV